MTTALWPMTLAEALRTAFENGKGVRVRRTQESEPVRSGAAVFAPPGREKVGIRIAPAGAMPSEQQFRGGAMALARSVEQQYWSLSQQQVQLWALEKAVELAEEVFSREQAMLAAGLGHKASVEEARQRWESLQLDLKDKQADVQTTERQLRTLLNSAPEADPRPIVPTTAPSESKVEPDWSESLATMTAKQPDLVSQREAVYAAALQWGRNLLSPEVLSRGGLELSSEPALAEAAVELQRQEAFFQQILHQTTHSLARFFLEVDANYKQLQTAKRYREATTHKLEVQSEFYKAGRIALDRYLDAISQYASAIAQEGQFKASYNISLIALEEMKGTLLAFEGIEVVTFPTDVMPAALPQAPADAVPAPADAVPAVVPQRPDLAPAPIGPAADGAHPPR